MFVIVDLQRIFSIACIIIFIIDLPTTFHMLSYNRSLEDKHQLEIIYENDQQDATV